MVEKDKKDDAQADNQAAGTGQPFPEGQYRQRRAGFAGIPHAAGNNGQGSNGANYQGINMDILYVKNITQSI